MADTAKKTEEIKDKLSYKEIHDKPFKELVKPPKEEKKVEPPVETPKEQSLPKEKQEVKVDVEKVVKEEVAKAKEELDTKIKKVEEDVTLTKKEKEEAKEDLRYTWQKEGRTPKDYDEIAKEAEERAFAKAQKYYAEQEKAREERLAQQEEERKTKQEADQKTTAELAKQEEDRVTQDVEKLINSGKLPRPANINDDNDPDAITYRDFFNQAIKYNQDHPEAPVRSPIEFYSLHYKASNQQPAGADAPIGGGKSTPKPADDDDKYVYIKDHGKSFDQIKAELRKKFAR